jgi:hypothetical protein
MLVQEDAAVLVVIIPHQDIHQTLQDIAVPLEEAVFQTTLLVPQQAEVAILHPLQVPTQVQ